MGVVSPLSSDSSLVKSLSHMNGMRRVVCGISGGVDSAVAAYLLKQKGFHVTGVFMTNWDTTAADGEHSSKLEQDREAAADVCRHVGIPFREANFVTQYWNEVFERLVTYSSRGLTVSADVLCNKFVHFDAFSKLARETLDADAIATGHFARTSLGPYLERRGLATDCRLLRAVDPVRDQTFHLSQVRADCLERVMFPVGGLLKPQVSAIARDTGLLSITHRRTRSSARSLRAAVDRYLPARRGVFRHCETREVLDHHDGVHHLTLGQRSALGGHRRPYFVSGLRADTQEVEVAPATNHPALFSRCLATGPMHWIGEALPELKSHGFAVCELRWRPRLRPVTCELVATDDGGLTVHLESPIRAVSPGQHAVFYKGDVCLGSALIVGSRSLFQEGHCDLVSWSVDDWLETAPYEAETKQQQQRERLSSRC